MSDLAPAAAGQRLFDRVAERLWLGSAHALENVAPLRQLLFGSLAERARSAPRDPRDPAGVAADKLALRLALIRLAERTLADGRLSDGALRGLLKVLLTDVFLRHGDQAAKSGHRARYGLGPPDFLVISPSRACNLRCVGCYANSGENPERLEFELVDELVGQARRHWGTRFFVISGGEPLAWRDRGRGVLELAGRHPECYFMMYTNGTLIDAALARRLSQLGNLSPSLSLEGPRARTDARRGAGVFDLVVAAAERLRGEGVFFGLSLTATRENAEELLSDALIERFFDGLGAGYAWVFHYMPIGRAFTLDLMPTPRQRVALWRRMRQLVDERQIFLADFWNGATATSGCVAAGRPGGYFYVDWNGNLSPCVFIPYTPVNVRELFARGQTLEDAWEQPFFAALRGWQRGYGYREPGQPHDGVGNWLRPCPIRDHHAEFVRLLREHGPRPNDADAAAALADPEYHAGLERFGRELAELSDPLWAKHVRRNGRPH